MSQALEEEVDYTLTSICNTDAGKTCFAYLQIITLCVAAAHGYPMLTPKVLIEKRF